MKTALLGVAPDRGASCGGNLRTHPIGVGASSRRRLIAITGESFTPTGNAWGGSFERLQERGRLVFTASLARSFFVRHGTSVEPRLTIFDKILAESSS